GNVVGGFGAAEFVDVLRQELGILRNALKRRQLVEASVKSAFHGSAVIANLPKDERVVELADLFERIDDASRFIIGLRRICGKDLHQWLGDAPLVGRKRIPGGNFFRAWSQLCIRRNDAELELALIRFFAVLIPALAELALKFLDPFFWDMVRRMRRTRSIIDEKRTIRRD